MLRKFFIVPALAGTMFLANCSQGANGTIVLNPAVADALQKAVALGCGVIPSVESLVGVVGVLFPQVSGVATIVDTVASQISENICKTVNASVSDSNMITAGVPIHGWKVGPDGKLVQF